MEGGADGASPQLGGCAGAWSRHTGPVGAAQALGPRLGREAAVGLPAGSEPAGPPARCLPPLASRRAFGAGRAADEVPEQDASSSSPRAWRLEVQPRSHRCSERLCVRQVDPALIPRTGDVRACGGLGSWGPIPVLPSPLKQQSSNREVRGRGGMLALNLLTPPSPGQPGCYGPTEVTVTAPVCWFPWRPCSCPYRGRAVPSLHLPLSALSGLPAT